MNLTQLPDRVVEMDAVKRILHSDHGRGLPALVFIHAFGCNRSDWDAQVAHFSPLNRCISVDLGGHGLTPGRSDHAKVEIHGADVVALMRELDLGPSIVVGNSFGCRVAMEISARAPNLTEALILVDGSQLSPMGENVHAALGAGTKPKEFPALARKLFSTMFSPGFDFDKVSEMTERATRVPPQLAVDLLADIGRYDSEKMVGLLEAVQVPVMAIQSTYITSDGARHQLKNGESSPYLNLLCERVRNFRAQIIPNSGHYPQVERPNETNAAIEQFLNEIG